MSGARRGPIEETPWPERITARVVSPGGEPRIHGYDVQRDLAPRYGLVDTFFLAITGELPESEAEARAVEVALAFLAPATAAEAPAHAAGLARLCGAATSAVIGTGAIALAEEARFLLAQHGPLLEWLSGERRGAPPGVEAAEEERQAVARLLVCLEAAPGYLPPPGLGLLASLLAVLFAAGLRTPEQLEAAFVWARLPCVMAEALAVKPGRFRKYPMDLPAYRYSGRDA